MDVVQDKAYQKVLPYIKMIEQDALKGPISLHILVTDFCVNKCNMCLHWATETKKVMTMETLSRIWDDMNTHNGESICLTGGDPVRHPFFNDILKLPRKFDLGFVNTGNFQKDFDWNLLNGIRWIRFSIDSLKDDVYKTIRMRNNLHSEILPNILRSQQYVKEIGINFTIQHINHEEVLDIIKWSADNGIYRLILYPMHGDAVLGLTKEDERRVKDQLERAADLGLWDEFPENNFQFLYDNLLKSEEDDEADVRHVAFNLEKHPCMINKIHLSIGSDGTVFPCEVIADDTDAYKLRNFWVKYIEDENGYKEIDEQIIHALGNVNDESLIDIWKRNLHNSFRSEKCLRCWSRYQPVINAYHENKGKKTFI